LIGSVQPAFYGGQSPWQYEALFIARAGDERMRELISLRAFGLSELDAVRYYVALKMAERGLVSAPNVAVGEPFNYGITSFAAVPGLDSRGAAAPAQQAQHNPAG